MEAVDGGEVVLRATSTQLWVARCGSYPAGTIEGGRKYTALDLDGRVIARSRSLQGAWEALSAPEQTHPIMDERRRDRRTWWIGAAGVIVTPVALLGTLSTLLLH